MLACFKLLKRMLTKEALQSAHALLLEFCNKFVELYGSEHCTPNMHLHLHLRECLLDCGPAYATWCFSFERFNGILESFHTNHKEVELQVMKKFTQKQLVRHLNLDKELDVLHSPLQKEIDQNHHIPSAELPKVWKMILPGYQPCVNLLQFSGMDAIRINSRKYERALNTKELSFLQQVYSTLYPSVEVIHASHFCQFCNQVILAGDVLTAKSSRGER